jgi:hypothetical protein
LSFLGEEILSAEEEAVLEEVLHFLP